MVWPFVLMLALLVSAVILSVVLGVIKRGRRARIQAMFRQYNEAQDVSVINSWIEQGRPQKRLLETLEYLMAIDEPNLAREVLLAFGVQRLNRRHASIAALRVLLDCGELPQAVSLARALRQAFPQDMSIFEIYLDTHLSAGIFEPVAAELIQAVEQRPKDPSLIRQYARLLAHRGDLPRAIGLLEKVLEREQSMARNTIAQPQKTLIHRQAETSAQWLADWRDQLDRQQASGSGSQLREGGG